MLKILMDRQEMMGLYASYMGVYGEEISEEESTMPPRRSPEERAARAKEVGDKQTRKTIVDKYNKNRPSSRQENPEKYDPKEEVDLYDLVLEYLLDEGLCESVENAEIMMAHMSEGWVESIIDEAATIMAVKSPKGEERKVSKLRSGQETPEQIQKRAFSQQLSDRQKERQNRMNAGRATVARKRGMEMANWKNQTKYYDRDEYDEADDELDHNAAHDAHLSNVKSKAKARKGR